MLARAESSTTPEAGNSTARDSTAALKALTLQWYRSVQSLSPGCTLNVGPSFVIKISEITLRCGDGGVGGVEGSGTAAGENSFELDDRILALFELFLPNIAIRPFRLCLLGLL